MTTSEIYKKHFPSVYGGAGVGIFHPNMEAFFTELNEVCKEEDRLKKLNSEQNPEVCDATGDDSKENAGQKINQESGKQKNK